MKKNERWKSCWSQMQIWWRSRKRRGKKKKKIEEEKRIKEMIKEEKNVT